MCIDQFLETIRFGGCTGRLPMRVVAMPIGPVPSAGAEAICANQVRVFLHDALLFEVDSWVQCEFGPSHGRVHSCSRNAGW